MIFNQGAIMDYKVEMSNWNLDISIESSDFELLAEIQCAIKACIENYDIEAEFDEEDDEEEVSYTLVAKKK
jgi:hypothetical protein